MRGSQSITEQFYQRRRTLPGLEDLSAQDKQAINVGWRCRGSQHELYSIATDLSQVHWPNIESILDLGCGDGELANFLRSERDFRGHYTGIDLVESNILEAKNRFGLQLKNRFILGECFNQDWSEQSFDVVISLGVISVNLDYPDNVGENTLAQTKQLCDLIIELAQTSAVLYFPCSDSISKDRLTANSDMAFLPEIDVYTLLYNAVQQSKDKVLSGIDMTSSLNREDARTIAKVYWTPAGSGNSSE